MKRYFVLFLADFSITNLKQQIASEKMIGYTQTREQIVAWLYRNSIVIANDEMYDNKEYYTFIEDKKYNYYFLEKVLTETELKSLKNLSIELFE